MPDRFTVLIADFLDETSIESGVLGDIAELVMARATDESQLGPLLPRADAIMVFHDLSILGEASFARAAAVPQRDARRCPSLQQHGSRGRDPAHGGRHRRA